MTTEIKLVQLPIIQQNFDSYREELQKYIAEQNLDNLIATEETVQSLKSLRANLNRMNKEVTESLTLALSPVTDIVTEIKENYKSKILLLFKASDDTLKDKIGSFENVVKTEKKNNIIAYFAELCAASKIDFLKFEHTGLEINLSTSEKQYKEKCTEFVNRVQDDIMLINGMDFAPETLVEYKSNGFNASKAISTVRDREEAKKLEAERLKRVETNKRIAKLQAMSMVYHDITKTYNYVSDESIYIEYKDVENLSASDWLKEITDIEILINTLKAALQAASQPVSPEQVTVQQKPAPAPLEAPKEVQPEVQEKKLVAAFEVTGTMAQLKALGQYLRDNKITYKNI